MTDIGEIISKRCSCRSYADTPIEKDAFSAFEAQVGALHRGLFGNTARFALLSVHHLPQDEWKKLGTYGVVKHARMYLAGMIRPAAQAACDFGYCMEKLILEATRLSVSTCWLGGTFSVGAFAAAAGLRDGEELPCVSPIGYSANQKSLTERLLRRIAGSDARKPWRELFFIHRPDTPLSSADAGPYAEALENVRLAPSASNKQPWRIVYNPDRHAMIFYLSPAPAYRHLRKISLQEIDMGIALCHFDLTVQESGLAGVWLREADAPNIQPWQYIATWQAEN